MILLGLLGSHTHQWSRIHRVLGMAEGCTKPSPSAKKVLVCKRGIKLVKFRHLKTRMKMFNNKQIRFPKRSSTPMRYKIQESTLIFIGRNDILWPYFRLYLQVQHMASNVSQFHQTLPHSRMFYRNNYLISFTIDYTVLYISKIRISYEHNYIS